MITLGKYNELTVARDTEHGYYLNDGEGNEVLLPGNSISAGLSVNDKIEVFVYNDSEDRIIATTLHPKITLGEFVKLEVKSVTKFGVFMDWGLQKDLLVPFSEQSHKLTEGENAIIYLLLDEKSDRLIGSARIEKFLDNSTVKLTPGDMADIKVFNSTEMGYKVIVNNIHLGLLYKNEVFQSLEIGAEMKGYIKKVRDDRKIDVSLHKFGYRNIAPNAEKILNLLNENNGFLNLTDKSTPEDIAVALRMSKKTFKKAVGDLYKQRILRIEEDGIFLIGNNS